MNPKQPTILSFNLQDFSQDEIDNLKQHLPITEINQANRFKQKLDQNRFVIARAKLRIELSKQLGIPTTELSFSKNEFGKPELNITQNSKGLNFNLSHSGDFILIAICEQRAIGIDVEKTSRKIEYLEIAKRFFHPDEYQFLSNCQGEDLKTTFFHIWTCKEAVLKAYGFGIAHGLNNFCVQPNPDKEPKVIFSLANCYSNAKLNTWNINQNYRAAYCIIEPN